jgi:hypothetical protein
MQNLYKFLCIFFQVKDTEFSTLQAQSTLFKLGRGQIKKIKQSQVKCPNTPTNRPKEAGNFNKQK